MKVFSATNLLKHLFLFQIALGVYLRAATLDERALKLPNLKGTYEDIDVMPQRALEESMGDQIIPLRNEAEQYNLCFI